ncbi:MAG: GNAT family N-acetyltransferase, partial [Angelakisella sp.]
MIAHLSSKSPAFRGLCGHPFLMTMVGGRAACPQPDMDFWALEPQPEEQTAFLCRSGSALFITGRDSTATTLRELAAFAQAVGFCCLTTDLPLPLAQSGAASVQPMVAMTFAGSGRAQPLPVGLQLRVCDATCQQLSPVEFARLQYRWGGLATAEEGERYAVALSHELRHGGGTALLLCQNEQPVAAAALSCRWDNHVVLSAVAVNPAQRGQGLGRAVAAAAAQLAYQQQLTTLLCCRPALEQLYTMAG